MTPAERLSRLGPRALAAIDALVEQAPPLSDNRRSELALILRRRRRPGRREQPAA